MTRGYVPLLLLLAGIWGASYLFIKVAVDEVEPSALTFFRMLLAGGFLVGVLLLRTGAREAFATLRGNMRHIAVLGVLNSALPFWLIGWGETYIDSGVAAIGNSTVPIFVALLAIRLRPSERASGARLAGILIGLVGVGVLVGVQPDGGWWAVAGTLAVVLSSLCYARSNLYYQEHVAHVPPLVIAAGTIATGALVMLPFGLVQLPDHVPGWKPIASIIALGILGTAVGLLLNYGLIGRHGAARAALVTYLIPVFALFYGALLLDEAMRLSAVLGLALILMGVALGSGLVRMRRRAEAGAVP